MSSRRFWSIIICCVLGVLLVFVGIGCTVVKEYHDKNLMRHEFASEMILDEYGVEIPADQLEKIYIQAALKWLDYQTDE